ncbi:hypothetical protein JCM8115_006114 [Rhodotorula mucilaginosa]|uniref:Uncharacterized protein n=1 Tax=Rhodotorula mucilaginosa TaxID=5537 RepID=A0A9P6VXK9_RHOMI|nr:hypothetical protein C6P46_007079 [Rhodotorula mucilaginosa]TKA56133.1 hypothetical protein B0A53_01423 [Rhodotorula sp. CCFEE 5036]
MSSNPKHLGLRVSSSTPEGYEFSYMHIQAVKYLNDLRKRVFIEQSDEPLLDDISPIVSEALEDMEDELAAQDDPASFLQGHPSWTGFLHLYCAFGHWRFAEYDEAVAHLRKLHNLAKSNEIRRLDRRFGEILAKAYSLTRYPNFPDMPEYPPKPGRENVRWHFEPRSVHAAEMAEEAEAMSAGVEGMTLEEKEDGGAAVEAEGTTADLGSVVEEA